MVMRTTPSFPPPPATSAAGGQEDKGLFLGPSSRWTSAQPPPSGSPPPGLVRLPHPLIRALPGKRLWQGPLGPLIAGQVSTRPSLGPRPLPPAGTQLRALCSGTVKACPQTQATSIQAETSGRPAHGPRLLSGRQERFRHSLRPQDGVRATHEATRTTALPRVHVPAQNAVRPGTWAPRPASARGTHITELVAGAGGFAEAVVLTVAVAPSGHCHLHLETGRDRLSKHRPDAFALLAWCGAGRGRARSGPRPPTPGRS